jgi:hypothetical protein
MSDSMSRPPLSSRIRDAWEIIDSRQRLTEDRRAALCRSLLDLMDEVAALEVQAAGDAQALKKARAERAQALKLAEGYRKRAEVLEHGVNAVIGQLDSAGAIIRQARARVSSRAYDPPPYPEF